MNDTFTERERADAAAAAHKTCDERFPIRYRQAGPSEPAVADWVTAFHADPSTAKSLLLLGPVGTGKSWQGWGALRVAVTVPTRLRAGLPYTPGWRATTYADFVASMRPRAGAALHDPEQELEKLRSAPLLFLDDLGVAKGSDYVEEVTYRLINGRYEDMRPSIFTTNLPAAQLQASLGDRIASRLIETCTQVVLKGVDRRRVRAA